MTDSPSARPPSSVLRVGIAYALMIAATVVIFLLIRSFGGRLHAPAPTGGALFGVVAGRQEADTLLHVLVALAVVIITARVLGALFKHQVGVILYMFLVGLHLDTATLRRGTHTTIAISHASITAPFLLGAGLALWLYPRLSSSDVPFTAFALFMGVSMSVTAFPVLARILTDRGMHKSRLGSIALTCAAVDDVTAWCLLAFVSSVVYAQVTGAVYPAVLSVAYIGLVVLIVRPITGRLARWVDTRGALTQPVIAAVLVAALLSALSTEYIGIHAIFGAFVLGAIIPHDSVIAPSSPIGWRIWSSCCCSPHSSPSRGCARRSHSSTGSGNGRSAG